MPYILIHKKNNFLVAPPNPLNGTAGKTKKKEKKKSVITSVIMQKNK